jgi:hypothetical protein
MATLDLQVDEVDESQLEPITRSDDFGIIEGAIAIGTACDLLRPLGYGCRMVGSHGTSARPPPTVYPDLAAIKQLRPPAESRRALSRLRGRGDDPAATPS